MSFEYYSSLALVSSVVVYALAMFAHAAEWAAARRLGGTEPAARELVDVAAAERSDGQLPPAPSQVGPEPVHMSPEPVHMSPEPVEGRDHPHSTSVTE